MVRLSKRGDHLLVYTRIIMFFLLGMVFFNDVPKGNLFLKGYVIIAVILFVCNHFLIISGKHGRISFYLILLDGLLSFSFGIFFPHMSLYLILFGVVAVTLTIHESSKIRLWIGIAMFFVSWGIVIVYSARVMGEWAVFENLISGSFVGFGAVVGSLIRKLYDAQETMDAQYKQLNESHVALTDAHEQLRHYSEQVENLTTIRERNRIARDIHDTVGHKMTALIVQLELARELLKLDSVKAENTLKTCDNLARGALQELRFSVRTLHEDEGEEYAFIPTIRTMLNDFRESTQLEAKLSVSGDPTVVPISLQPTLIRIIQESVTNAKRHGGATICHIKLNCSAEEILLVITDNGIGTGMITKGFGLINMKERIEEHGGSVTFESNEGEGFCVKVHFPLLERTWIAGKRV
jgi:signal transduction histidine kinase